MHDKKLVHVQLSIKNIEFNLEKKNSKELDLTKIKFLQD